MDGEISRVEENRLQGLCTDYGYLVIFGTSGQSVSLGGQHQELGLAGGFGGIHGVHPGHHFSSVFVHCDSVSILQG